jgi:HdeA/HdeB family
MDRDMRTPYPATALTIAALLVGLGAGPVSAQDNGDRTVEQFTCKDVMRESGANRDVVIAFLSGFLLGKSGSSKFNLVAVRQQADDLIEHCLDNPGEKAVEAAAKVRR